MGRSLFHAAMFLTAGLVLGLGAGAWLWRGEVSRVAHKHELAMAARSAPRVPSTLRRPAAGVGDEAREGGAAGAPADRRAELGARFRALRDAREEGLSMHADALVGLAGLRSEDFARLLGLLAEPKLDDEVAVFPLIRWAAIDPKAALAFAKEAPDEAFEWAGTIQNSGVRSEMLGESIRAWARKDAAAAQAAVATLIPEQRGNLLEIIEREKAAKK